MAASTRHYNKDGSPFKGSVHRMANGVIHSGKTHSSKSKRVYHFKDLSKSAQKKARKSWRSK